MFQSHYFSQYLDLIWPIKSNDCQSQSLIFYYDKCVDVLPQETLNWMAYNTQV